MEGTGYCAEGAGDCAEGAGLTGRVVGRGGRSIGQADWPTKSLSHPYGLRLNARIELS